MSKNLKPYSGQARKQKATLDGHSSLAEHAVWGAGTHIVPSHVGFHVSCTTGSICARAQTQAQRSRARCFVEGCSKATDTEGHKVCSAFLLTHNVFTLRCA